MDYWYDADGSLVLKARLPALAGAMLVKALEAAMTAVPTTGVNVDLAEEHPLSYQARRADALAAVAESYLERESASGSTADRYQVVVHVDAETLKEQTAGRCHIDDDTAATRWGGERMDYELGVSVRQSGRARAPCGRHLR